MTDDGAARISGHLRRAIVELGRARDRAARTDTAAAEARRYIARYGFPGIARSIDGIRGQVGVVQEVISAAVSATAEASGIAASIPDGSPGEMLAALDALLAAVEAAVEQTGTALAEAAIAQAVVNGALAGGTPVPLLGRLENVCAALDGAASALGTTHTAAVMAKARVRTAGALGANAVATSADVAPQAERRSEPGNEPVEPGERLGAKIHDAEGRRSRFARARNEVTKDGDELVEDGAKIAQHFQSLIQRKDPDMCIPISAGYPEIGVPQPERPDPQHAAGSILDATVFIFDVIVLGIRKVRERDKKR